MGQSLHRCHRIVIFLFVVEHLLDAGRALVFIAHFVAPACRSTREQPAEHLYTEHADTHPLLQLQLTMGGSHTPGVTHTHLTPPHGATVGPQGPETQSMQAVVCEVFGARTVRAGIPNLRVFVA